MLLIRTQKSPSQWTGFLSILMAWGGIEPPTQGFSIPMRTLGVIGPMLYEKMIQIVDITSKLH